jgi:hypothetical protein
VEAILQNITNEFKNDSNILSIVLIGSGSRGEIDQFSDVDIHIVVRNERPPDRIFYHNDRLVNINFLDRQNREAMFTDPWYTLKNMAAVRAARILFDPDTWYKDFQRRAKQFSWEQVAKEADIALSWVLAENAEMVQKILSGRRSQNSEKTLYATVSLVQSLTDVTALANGVLCNSENRFWSAVRDSETDSEWKIFYWKALGFNGETIDTRSEATLNLYRKSCTLYQHKILPQRHAIIEHINHLINSEL